MNLSDLKQTLGTITTINILQPNGQAVPQHFHITEAGLTTKNFIDCGGTIRSEKMLNLQVWVAQDTDHRLIPEKLNKILSIYEKNFGTDDLPVEVEYQTDTVGRYGLKFDGQNFQLTTKQTDCLASDHCGITEKKQKLQLAELTPTDAAACCTPGGGCC
ncbi:MAG: DUF6428 family protein [Bacteroidota bacterium]